MNNYNKHIAQNIPYNGYATENPQSTFGVNYPPTNFASFTGGYNQPDPLIDRPLYRNNGKLLHNNVKEEMINEKIVEYKLFIDSLDRNVEKYPDPLNFTIHFGSETTSRIHNRRTGETTYITDEKGPSISRTFRNVKYVRVDHLMIPRHTTIVKLNAGGYAFESSSLTDDRYILVNVPELESTTTYGSNRFLGNSFVTLVDRTINDFYFIGYVQLSRIFEEDTLGNLNKITFKLLKANGENIKYKIVDESGNELNEKLDTDPSTVDSINNALNNKIQIFLSLTVGVVENHVGTDIKYSK